MSRELTAILFAFGAVVCWGAITPFLVGWQRALGSAYHPMLGMFFSSLVGLIYSSIFLAADKFAPLGVWSWKIAVYTVLVGLIWPVGGIMLSFAVERAPQMASVSNAIAGTYPALVSLPILWLFFNEAISLQRALALIGVAVCVFIAVRSQ